MVANNGDVVMNEVSGQAYDVVGLSLFGEGFIDPLASLIGKIRSVSKNQAVCILVGGGVFNNKPELVHKVDADGTARNGREAVAMAEHVVGMVTGPQLTPTLG